VLDSINALPGWLDGDDSSQTE